MKHMERCSCSSLTEHTKRLSRLQRCSCSIARRGRACLVSAWDNEMQLMHQEVWASLTSTPPPHKVAA